jgi:uncharacterized protein
MKFVILLIAVLLLLWLLFGRTRRVDRKAPPSDAARRSIASEGMVACAHCGVHVPASEAVQRDGRSYCGVAHRDAGPQAGGS